MTTAADKVRTVLTSQRQAHDRANRAYRAKVTREAAQKKRRERRGLLAEIRAHAQWFVENQSRIALQVGRTAFTFGEVVELLDPEKSQGKDDLNLGLMEFYGVSPAIALNVGFDWNIEHMRGGDYLPQAKAVEREMIEAGVMIRHPPTGAGPFTPDYYLMSLALASKAKLDYLAGWLADPHAQWDETLGGERHDKYEPEHSSTKYWEKTEGRARLWLRAIAIIREVRGL